MSILDFSTVGLPTSLERLIENISECLCDELGRIEGSLARYFRTLHEPMYQIRATALQQPDRYLAKRGVNHEIAPILSPQADKKATQDIRPMARVLLYSPNHTATDKWRIAVAHMHRSVSVVESFSDPLDLPQGCKVWTLPTPSM